LSIIFKIGFNFENKVSFGKIRLFLKFGFYKAKILKRVEEGRGGGGKEGDL
jgi:hypothetical protein